VIGVHADRYRLEVDAEHGIILSVHAFFADQAYQTIDVIELQFDGPVNDELFAFPERPASQTAA
jgi:outer membrane lipoprotein-sorting protein